MWQYAKELLSIAAACLSVLDSLTTICITLRRQSVYVDVPGVAPIDLQYLSCFAAISARLCSPNGSWLGLFLKICSFLSRGLYPHPVDALNQHPTRAS